jgi:hypothetical protein
MAVAVMLALLLRANSEDVQSPLPAWWYTQPQNVVLAVSMPRLVFASNEDVGITAKVTIEAGHALTISDAPASYQLGLVITDTSGASVRPNIAPEPLRVLSIAAYALVPGASYVFRPVDASLREWGYALPPGTYTLRVVSRKGRNAAETVLSNSLVFRIEPE